MLPQPIAPAADGVDEADAEGLFQLAAQAADVDVHAVAATRQGGEGVTRHELSAMGEQAGKDGGFGGCQGDAVALHRGDTIGLGDGDCSVLAVNTV